MTKDEALKLAFEALEGVLDDAPKVLDASIAGGLYEVVQCRDAITAIKQALAQPEQEPAGDEWTPCMKLPVVVHVRKQRPGEAHVSTREGITPVKPDDLIMRGVSGEEYPIGRAIFEQTYSLDTTPPLPVQPEQEPNNTRPCRSCGGTGDQDTGIAESPIATCKPCKGTGQIALAQPEERNFCPRCGKRTAIADLVTIHTCTPPRGNA